MNEEKTESKNEKSRKYCLLCSSIYFPFPSDFRYRSQLYECDNNKAVSFMERFYGQKLSYNFHRYPTPVTRGRGISYCYFHLASPKSIPSSLTYRLPPNPTLWYAVDKRYYFCSTIFLQS